MMEWIGKLAAAVAILVSSWNGGTEANLSPSKVDQVVVLVTGDVMPGRMVNVKLKQLNDFDWPFSNHLLNGGDEVFINLESPVISNCPLRREGFKFCSDERIVPALKRAGVTIANLANNHMGNEGEVGVEQTKQLLKEQGIKYTGTTEEVIATHGDIRIGFLGFNDVGHCPKGIECASEEKIKQQVADLKAKVDLVVVQFHWGQEYTNEPTSRQRKLGQLAVASGAELVVGNHPHWVQKIEKYQEKLIVYSHGNFLFDQQWSKPTQQGVVGKYVFSKTGLVSYEFLPMVVEGNYQPRWANEEEANSVRNRMGI